MAPPSPRRSSRAARPTNSQSNQSSVSSSTTGRSERNTRSVNKPASGKSTPSGSLSSEPPDEFEDTLLSRRRKRGVEEDSERTSRIDDYEMATTNDEDLQDEEDEAVRCICGAEDYPGRPPVEGPEAEFFAGIELTEEVTGFFVQCDVCKVWQHGACVGIFSAEASPDEYFCEQCRKDLHKVHTASNGQKYSKFLPLHQTSRTTSRATSLAKEGTRSPRSGSKGARARQGSVNHLGKRRSTMNSRDAAYDDEQLRRAIEASKEDPSVDGLEGVIRRPKRGRSDSEDGATNVKRQRTSSRSASPTVEGAEPANGDDSDDEGNARNSNKKARTSRPQREKTEREERERQRQEAADKRKGRAERRRADDSDPSDELPLAAKSIKKSVEPSHPAESHNTTARPTPDTPPPVPAVVASTLKRGARSTHKKTKGRNQYTKERELDNDDSPARSMSRDIAKATEDSTPTTHSKPSTDHKHGPKSKTGLPSKMTMLDMKRRVAAIMDFISRTQIDLATEEIATSSSNSTSASASDSPTKKDPPRPENGVTGADDESRSLGATAGEAQDKEFKNLNCMEMMDVLTRDMVKWQNQYV